MTEKLYLVDERTGHTLILKRDAPGPDWNPGILDPQDSSNIIYFDGLGVDGVLGDFFTQDDLESIAERIKQLQMHLNLAIAQG